MNRKAQIAIAVAVLLIGGLWVRYERRLRLPRFPLAADSDGSFPGGEFRVFKICYGGEDDQRLGGSSGSRFRLWKRLPASLKKIIPEPETGVQSITPVPPYTAISIWWNIVDPVTHQLEFGNCEEVTMTLDNGEDWNLSYPNFGEDPRIPPERNLGYRQNLVTDPPRDSRKLHFAVPIEDQIVEFTIANPAYGR